MKSQCPVKLKKPRAGMNEPAASACWSNAWVTVRIDGKVTWTCYRHSKKLPKVYR